MLARMYARDYAGRSERLFLEPLVARELARNGVLSDFSNSFLVVASHTALECPCNILAASYSVGRRPQYATETRITRDVGGILVNKQPLCSNLVSSPPEPARSFRQNFGTAPYIVGSLVWWKLTEQRARALGTESIVEALAPWFDFLLDQAKLTAGCKTRSLANYEIHGIYLDCVPFNLIESDGQLTFIDQEWQVDGEIPLGWVITRAIATALVSYPGLEESPIKPTDIIRALCARHSISIRDKDIRGWLEQEDNFRFQVLGTEPPRIDLNAEFDLHLNSYRLVTPHRQVADLQVANTERERRIAGYEAMLLAANSREKASADAVTAHQAQLVKAEQVAQELSASLAARSEEVGRLQFQLAECHTINQAYRTSTSWKLTAPPACHQVYATELGSCSSLHKYSN